MAVELLPHQLEAIEKLSHGKVLVGGVGVGKTHTALGYYILKVVGGELNKPETFNTRGDIPIYVFTTARKRDDLDWQHTAALMHLGDRLVVDSYNNIGNYTQVHGAFVILDEQRMVGSGAWTKAFLHMAKSNHWIMLSATPGDTWEDYIPLFVANGFFKNRTQFKREHIVYNNFGPFPKVERYLGVGKLVRLRHEILVKMPYPRHTVRHIHKVTVDYDKQLFEQVVKKRWHVYEDRPLKDVSELFSVMRKVVNTNVTRLNSVAELLTTHPRLIVFYNFDYELEMLRTLTDFGVWEKNSDRNSQNISTETSFGVPTLESNMDQNNSKVLDPTQSAWTNTETFGNNTSTISSKTTKQSKTNTEFTLAEWNGHKHERVPDTDRWLYLVQYVAGAEAWNCTATDAVCFYSLTYSYKNFEQAKGRIDRLDTPYKDLHYYVLTSDSSIDRAVLASLLRKENFNEKKWVS